MKTIRKLRWILIIGLLGLNYVSVGQTRVNWSGNVNGQTISANTTVTVTGNVNLKGTIKVAAGKTLTINTAGNYTIKRTGFSGFMFNAGYTGNSNTEEIAHLTINGGNYTLTIDGGAVYETPNDALSGFKNNVVPANDGILIGCNGNLYLTNVILQNCYRHDDLLGVACHNCTNTAYTCEVKNCTFRGFWGGSLFYFKEGDLHAATFSDVEFTGNDVSHAAYGGCIRSNGGTRTSVTLNRCRMHHNKTAFGMIHWNASGLSTTMLTLMGNTEFDHNESTGHAGGVFNCAKMNAQSVYIHDNIARYGGGIYLQTYTGGSDAYNGDGYSMVISDSVKICNNTATSIGGGILARFNPSNDVGFIPTQHNPPASTDTLTAYFKIELNGGEISGNKAPMGGGIFIEDYAPNHHRWNYQNDGVLSGRYFRSVEVKSGKVSGNYSYAGEYEEENDNQCGAGIYIKKYNGENISYTTDFGTIDIKISGGRVYQNHAYLGTGTAEYNGCGGGLFAGNDFDLSIYTSNCNVLVSDTAQIFGNTCAVNGAGIFVNSGSFTMTGGTVGKSTAHNVADQDGGGFCVAGGTVAVSGGTINYNDAGRYGGGFFVNVPNTTDTTYINGGAMVSNNVASNGGGAYVNQGQLIIQDAATTIANDTASIAGGGIYLGTGSVTITDATLSGNVSQNSNGGGFYVANGSFTANNAAITSNHAPNGDGGGVYAGGNNGIVTLNAGTTVTNNNAINGGGICVDGGNLTFTNAVMTGNTASNDGGGFYTTGGDVQINGNSALISANTATVNGGGMFIGGDIELQGGVIKQNQTGNAGGGVYVTTGGDFTMTGGTIGGTTAEGNRATGANGAGGGLYMAGGTATVSGGAISGNSATVNGGGVFMFGESASCTLSDNAVIGGDRNAATPGDYANTAQYGGGIYSAGGVITVNGGSVAYNHASLDGGGIYSSGPNAKVYIQEEGSNESYVDHNSAERNGGGVFASHGEVHFSNGYVQYNFAENGGGMYVDKEGTGYGQLFLTGNAKLRRNHVPSGKKGGGVYLLGKVTVGAPGEQSSVTAENNFAFDATTPETYECDDETRNNIYLPEPMVRDDHTGLITVIKGCINATSKVGFSVPRNHVPVIYCEYSNADTPNAGDPSSHEYLNGFTTGEGHPFQYVLFEDSHRYISVHYTMYPVSVFHPDHVYLYGFWPEIVATMPDGFDPTLIRDERDLAWLISVVDGRYDEEQHELLAPNSLDGVSVTLQKDLDMSQFGWVPVGLHSEASGIADRPFKGTFNGNGHTIEGVNGMVYGQHNAFGLFGLVDDAEIGNVFVKNSEYFIESNSSHVIGGLVGIADGTSVISNSEVSSHMVADNADIVIGGLVGKLNSGTVHSAIAIPDMEGGIMGGLVGELASSGNLLNSFANAKFTTRSDASGKYQGGLAAVNRGRIENCYYHEQTGSTHSSKFGSLVGDNAGGTVSYSYAAATPYTATTAVAGTLSGHGLYADNTVTPYYYHRRDNQVTLASGANPYKPVALPGQNPQTSGDIDEQMLHYLNNWVDTINKHQNDIEYTRWSRPTTKVINDDLPLLLMPSGNAVAATAGDPYLEYGSANTRIADFKSSLQSIYMYRTQADSVRGNADSEAELYIDERVALIQAGELTAHVGVTLDNSAGINGAQPTFGGIEDTPVTDYTDWHMFATPLAEVPLGIKYVKSDGVTPDNMQWHNDPDNYYQHGDMPYYRFLPADQEGGYFPSMTYQYATANGFAYDGDNTTATAAGSYYNEWDFYCYYEPEYHWINFKRNGNDHWHENAPDFHIDYKPNGVDVMNEEYLIPGKGYLAATREHNTFLQAEGVLNGDAVTFPVTRSGAYSPGYNLLGNPYQAYLDFEIFADTNRALWNGDTPTYYILDEDSKDYVAYASQGSTNPARPEQFIHPHQGFMILLNSGDGGTAKFTPSMRNTRATTDYRDARPAYPLVNLSATEENGNRTMVTVELGRPDKGGAAVLKDMHVSRGKLYCRYEGEDYEIAFTRPGLTEASIRFETLEDTEYTMTWDTHNGEFSYLHLIDNLTGADVDCLAESEYRFTSRTSDYKSRFRLVFGYTGIEEPETPQANDGQSQFAFMMGGQLVVNGEGTLQVFDISGRQVMSTETHGTQTTVSLPRLSAGVYTMRLTTAGSTKVQKIVIR